MLEAPVGESRSQKLPGAESCVGGDQPQRQREKEEEKVMKG